jgi:hypothetical protein
MNGDAVILHLVLVGWKTTADESIRTRAHELAHGFVGVIPGVVAVEEGPSTSPEGLEDGHDWALVVTFDDGAAREGYLVHPDHVVLAELIRDNSDKVTVFDLDTAR